MNAPDSPVILPYQLGGYSAKQEIQSIAGDKVDILIAARKRVEAMRDMTPEEASKIYREFVKPIGGGDECA